MDAKIKEVMKDYIVEKVKQSTSIDRPYMFVRWSGLAELCRMYNLDLLQLIDELAEEKRIKKAVIKGRLALSLPDLAVSKKVKSLLQEFQEFLKK
jgi:hypothetical protein